MNSQETFSLEVDRDYAYLDSWMATHVSSCSLAGESIDVAAGSMTSRCTGVTEVEELVDGSGDSCAWVMLAPMARTSDKPAGSHLRGFMTGFLYNCTMIQKCDALLLWKRIA
jgi:hypothetical protein